MHAHVTTLADLLSLDDIEMMKGYMETTGGDPEPGPNHSRAYHHGWRMKMIDMGELPITPEHRRLTREYAQYLRPKN